MEYTVGAVVEGKVTGITKFGAFISLPGNKTGMVHISEIAHAYVNDINEFLTVGQEVKAMVIAVDEAGKINLSIKKTIDPPPRQNRNDRQGGGNRGYQNRGDRNDRNDRQGGGNRGYQNRGGQNRGDRNDHGSQDGQNAGGAGADSGERSERQGSERQGSYQNRNGGSRSYQNRGSYNRSNASREPQSFDDMLKQFMQDSDSNISSNKMYADHRVKKRRQ